MRRYLIQMTIRVVCFGLALIIAPNPWFWAPMIAAVVLPYFAVVGANAGAERPAPATNPYEALLIERAVASARDARPSDAHARNAEPNTHSADPDPAGATNPTPPVQPAGDRDG